MIRKRLFFSFPFGAPAWVLLLLRLVAGWSMMMYAGSCAASGHVMPILVAGIPGLFVVLGLLTPLAAAFAAVLALLAFSRLLITCFTIPTMELILGLSILLTLAVMGPGAFSMDARLFGRREVILPPRRRANSEN